MWNLIEILCSFKKLLIHGILLLCVRRNLHWSQSSGYTTVRLREFSWKLADKTSCLVQNPNPLSTSRCWIFSANYFVHCPSTPEYSIKKVDTDNHRLSRSDQVFLCGRVNDWWILATCYPDFWSLKELLLCSTFVPARAQIEAANKSRNR